MVGTGRERAGEGRREKEVFHLFPKDLLQPALGQAKARIMAVSPLRMVRKLVLGSPSPAILDALARGLDWKQGSQNLNQHFDTGCGCHKWQLNQLSHNTRSYKWGFTHTCFPLLCETLHGWAQVVKTGVDEGRISNRPVHSIRTLWQDVSNTFQGFVFTSRCLKGLCAQEKGALQSTFFFLDGSQKKSRFKYESFSKPPNQPIQEVW